MKRIALLCALCVVSLAPINASTSPSDELKPYFCSMSLYIAPLGVVKKFAGFRSPTDRSVDMGAMIIECRIWDV